MPKGHRLNAAERMVLFSLQNNAMKLDLFPRAYREPLIGMGMRDEPLLEVMPNGWVALTYAGRRVLEEMDP